MIYQKYYARCYRVYQHERNENASFLSIFNGGGRPKWWFSNFPRFWKNSSALGSFNCIFENNSLKASFGQNMKKLKILKLSPDSRYLQKLALNSDPREKPLEQSAVTLMAPIQSFPRLNQLVHGWLAPNDHLRDFESNRRYNWFTRIDQHVKGYF